MTPMQRGLIVIGALLLVLGAITWYWFQYISPYRHLARATPAKQNGFRLTKIDFVKGSKVLLHHMEVFIQLSPELADLGYRVIGEIQTSRSKFAIQQEMSIPPRRWVVFLWVKFAMNL
jgi:hypothetical protein